MLTKKELSEALWLSCVENYVLAWLGRMYDVRNLYGSSFVSVRKLFEDFSRGETFENYRELPRLQELAEDAGIIRHWYVRCRAEEAGQLLKRQGKDALCLVRVNTGFFRNYRRSSWREDHYICVDKELNWINQYPLSEGRFTQDRFAEVYDGGICLYRAEDLRAVPPDRNREAVLLQTFPEGMPEELRVIETAGWVLRLTRKRLAAYYREQGEVVRLLTEELALLDEICFRIRLKQIKEGQADDREELREKTLAAVGQPLKKVLALERKWQEVWTK